MTMPIRIRRFVLGAGLAMTLFGVTTQVRAQERQLAWPDEAIATFMN
jgi:hypothetical protein